MYYTDESSLPENQDPLIITAAPYGPIWMPADYPEDIPVTWEEQVQKAVDCYNAGRHGAAHPRARSADRATSRRTSSEYGDQIGRLRDGRAEDDPAGRRLDLVRAGGRRRQAHVAELRYPAHARRDRSEAGSGHGRHRLDHCMT